MRRRVLEDAGPAEAGACMGEVLGRFFKQAGEQGASEDEAMAALAAHLSGAQQAAMLRALLDAGARDVAKPEDLALVSRLQQQMGATQQQSSKEVAALRRQHESTLAKLRAMEAALVQIATSAATRMLTPRQRAHQEGHGVGQGRWHHHEAPEREGQ